jgi:hypothetical protein
MIDIETQKPLAVSVDGESGPYLMVPLDQLRQVREVLENHGIAHAVEEDAIQWDDKPAIAIVDFRPGADVSRIQAVLDAA